MTLQIACPFKITSEFERTEPIPRENKDREENTCDFDDNDSNPSEVSAHESRDSNEEPNNSDDMKAWGSANEHIFINVLRFTTTGPVQSVLLKFEPRNGQPGNGREAWLVLKKQVSEHFSPA